MPRRKKKVYIDLDGTLVYYERGPNWSPYTVGRPIEKMVKRVKDAHNRGQEIVIFTARLSGLVHAILGGSLSIQDAKTQRDMIVFPIQEWCATHLGFVPEVTCIKGYDASEFWDDRGVRVGENTGEPGTLDGTVWASLDA